MTGGPLFSPQQESHSTSFIDQLVEDGRSPAPEGGQCGTNETVPVALWPDPDDGTKADNARAIPRERVRR